MSEQETRAEPEHENRPGLCFEVFSIFPEIVEAFVGAGLLSKARERDLVQVHCTNPRDFCHDKHRSVDDAPFGGGAGMVIKVEPVVAALEAVTAARGPMHRILLTPSGARFDQRVAERLAQLPRIALLCGRYEGIDDRIREHWADECLSIGDFVLNGGEVAAAVIIEAVGRLHEGVLGNPDSIAHESFAESDVLEHPHYTRPASFRGHEVPPVLLAGDHGKIEAWRRRSACLRTWLVRPELRPPLQLDAGHVLRLIAPASLDADAREQLATLARSWGVESIVLGSGLGSRPNMRDLKQLRRHLRKRDGAESWLLGVGACGEGEPVRDPRMLLDVLAYEQMAAPGPLGLWLGEPDDPALRGTELQAWLALPEGPVEEIVRSNRPSRLALGSALIDISQPPAARASSVSLALRALSALRDQGLLPASVGGAPP